MKLFNKIFIALVFLSSSFIAGCATNTGKSFLADNDISIERIHTGMVHIEEVNVTKTNNGLSIHGSLKRYGNTRRPITGHVDVEILSSSGKKLSKSSSIGRKTRTKVLKSMFELELNTVPESGSVIRIYYHNK